MEYTITEVEYSSSIATDAVWEFKVDLDASDAESDWRAYEDDEAAKLERAFRAKAKKVALGMFEVDLDMPDNKNMCHRRGSEFEADPDKKIDSRPVRRRMASDTGECPTLQQHKDILPRAIQRSVDAPQLVGTQMQLVSTDAHPVYDAASFADGEGYENWKLSELQRLHAIYTDTSRSSWHDAASFCLLRTSGVSRRNSRAVSH